MSAINEDVAPATEHETSSSSDSDNDEDEVISEIALHKQRLEENPFLYDSYVCLIDLLGRCGDLPELRRVRKTFASNYPLTPNIWLSWIRDEQRLAVTKDEKLAVIDLFELAILDYVSVELWLEYCQFTMAHLEEVSDQVRLVFERAVVAVGVHVTKGSLIWNAYREFEKALLSSSPDDGEQAGRVDKLFRRQLAVPLISMEATYDEYAQWLLARSAKIDANVERAFSAAKRMLNARLTYESRLNDKPDGLIVYGEYINLEVQEGNPVRIQNVFERRVSDFCLVPTVWLEYADFLATQLKLIDKAFEVYQRSLRNCPWSAELWIKQIRCCEKLQKPTELVVKVVEDALSSGLSSPSDHRDVWLAFIDFKRRTLLKVNSDEVTDQEDVVAAFRSMFASALEQLADLAGDAECKVARYWAALEADRFQDVAKARQIWQEIMAGPAGDKAKFWIEFIHLEKAFGDTKHLRSLCARALAKTQDRPEEVGDIWLQFEREEGSLHSFEEAEAKVSARLKEHQSLAFAEGRKGVEKKRKRHEGASVTIEGAPKRPKKSDAASERVNGLERGKKLVASSSQREVFKQPLLAKEESKSEAVPPPPGYEEVPNSRTVFVSNLDFSVEEKAVESALGCAEDIEEIRLVRNYSGKSKGYGFVKFKSVAAAQSALQKDHQLLDGRPMYVSVCDPDKKKKGHQFKYSLALEKSKLFIKGLPKTLSVSDVHALFSPYGAIRDVRVVTYRNGHSKGIAYVDYLEEAAASTAIIKMDGTELEGVKISVAISNPPPKKDSQSASLDKSLGGSAMTSGPRGRGRTQVALVPTPIMKAAAVNSADRQQKTMSNADFRKLLF